MLSKRARLEMRGWFMGRSRSLVLLGMVGNARAPRARRARIIASICAREVISDSPPDCVRDVDGVNALRRCARRATRGIGVTAPAHDATRVILLNYFSHSTLSGLRRFWRRNHARRWQSLRPARHTPGAVASIRRAHEGDENVSSNDRLGWTSYAVASSRWLFGCGARVPRLVGSRTPHAIAPGIIVTRLRSRLEFILNMRTGSTYSRTGNPGRSRGPSAIYCRRRPATSSDRSS